MMIAQMVLIVKWRAAGVGKARRGRQTGPRGGGVRAADAL